MLAAVGWPCCRVEESGFSDLSLPKWSCPSWYSQLKLVFSGILVFLGRSEAEGPHLSSHFYQLSSICHILLPDQVYWFYFGFCCHDSHGANWNPELHAFFLSLMWPSLQDSTGTTREAITLQRQNGEQDTFHLSLMSFYCLHSQTYWYSLTYLTPPGH